MPVWLLEQQAHHQVAVAPHQLRARHGKLVLHPARHQPGPEEQVQDLEDLRGAAAHDRAAHLRRTRRDGAGGPGITERRVRLLWQFRWQDPADDSKCL